MVEIDPQVRQDAEPKGYEFGYCTFDSLPTVEVSNIDTSQDTSSNKGDEDVKHILRLPITDDMLSPLQSWDTFCSHIITQLKKGNIKDGQMYKFHDNLLKRNVTDSNKTYETIVLPRALTAQILKMGP